MSVNNFKYVGIFAAGSGKLLIDSKNIIKGSNFNEKQAQEILNNDYNIASPAPWKELSKPYHSVKVCSKNDYIYVIAIVLDARFTRNDATDFCFQSIEPALNQLTGSSNLQKTFEPQFRTLL